MHIIIPMSGLGNRFNEVGYAKHKSLLLVDGRPIIEHVLDMFPGEQKITFICNEQHLRDGVMGATLRRIAPTADIVAIAPHKKGPVFAVSQVFDRINDDEDVMMSYCDYSQAWDFDAFKREVRLRDAVGAVPSYTGFHPHLIHRQLYGGIRADVNGNMLDYREKHSFTENPEESHHSGGAYYFRTGKDLKNYFYEVMNSNLSINGEQYISMPYYLLLRDGKSVFVPEVEHFMQWGTPADLEEYEAWSRLIHSEEGRIKEKTDIPASREVFVRIPHEVGSLEYEKSHAYWKNYFQKKWQS